MRLAALAAVLAMPAGALAQPAGGDAMAPGLSVGSDVQRPFVAIALAIDPIGLAFGTYGASLEWAPAPSHGVWVSPSWRRDVQGLALDVAYHLWFLGHGLHGIFAGPTLGGALSRGERDVWVGAVGAEAGFAYVWKGISMGLAAGAARAWASQGAGVRTGWAPTLRASVGYAWT